MKHNNEIAVADKPAQLRVRKHSSSLAHEFCDELMAEKLNPHQLVYKQIKLPEIKSKN
jgi:hypothetical protein